MEINTSADSLVYSSFLIIGYLPQKIRRALDGRYHSGALPVYVPAGLQETM